MSTPTITTAPPMASFDRPAQWDDEMMAFLVWMQALPPQLNYLIPFLVSAAGPNGIAGTARFSTTTTAADPGPGYLRLNNATQASATAAFMDLIDANGIDVTTLLARLGIGTSTVKGELRLALAADPTKWISFEVTTATSPTGYRSLVLQNGVGSGSFAADDVLTWSYSRSGDMGNTGPTADGPHVHTQEQYTSGTNPPTPTAAAWNDRSQNTVLDNLIGATVSGGQVTLTVAGVYHFEGDAAAFGVNGNRLRVRNITDSANVPGAGVVSQAMDLGSSYLLGANPRIVTGRVTIVAAKTFALQHYVQAAGTGGTGLGKPIATGDPEVMSDFRVYKH